jgi:hypothetical protein
MHDVVCFCLDDIVHYDSIDRLGGMLFSFPFFFSHFVPSSFLNCWRLVWTFTEEELRGLEVDYRVSTDSKGIA